MKTEEIKEPIDMSMNKYKEFYEVWMKTYNSTYGKIYPAQIPSQKEALESFVKSADESNKVFMSWINEFGENSRKTVEVLNDGNNPAKYRDCYDNWLKTYEKVFDDLNDNPAIKYQREVFSRYTGVPNFYSDSLTRMSKQMKELYTKVYIPSEDTRQKFSEILAKSSKVDANPEIHREFYNLWMKTYKGAFSGMFDPMTMKPSKELLDNLKESTDISLNLFKSWVLVLEKMSEKMKDQSKLMNDPEAFREFYILWIKMFEKSSEDILEGVPLVSPVKEMMEPVKSAYKIYASTSIKMSKMWVDSFSRMTPAQKV